MARLAFLYSFFLFCGTSLSAQQLTELWKMEGQFIMPESATFDSAAEHVFVSNVNEYAKDGNGFISRVSIDGTEFVQHWLDGLDSPTGLAVSGGLLYFADFDSLVVADLATAQILRRYLAPDANPSLNDVAISPDGDVFVSGSASNSIYRLSNSEFETWLHDDQLLLQANGLYIDGDYLFHGGRYWNVFDRHTKELLTDSVGRIPELESIDGITKSVCGDYLLTLIEDERLWRLGDDLAAAFQDGPINGIDIHGQEDLLIVPQVGGDLTLYRQEIASCAQ